MGTFVLYVEEASVLGYLSRFWRYMTLFLLIAAILAVVFILHTRQTVHIPMTKLLKAIDKVKTESLDTPSTIRETMSLPSCMRRLTKEKQKSSSFWKKFMCKRG